MNENGIDVWTMLGGAAAVVAVFHLYVKQNAAVTVFIFFFISFSFSILIYHLEPIELNSIQMENNKLTDFKTLLIIFNFI